MTGNMNMKSRSIINVKQAQAHNYQNHEKYVDNRLNLSVGGADLWNKFSYIMNNSGQFSNEDDIAGVKFIYEDFHQLNIKA